jgi:redox-sensitive bicupin YhaK (pirin superfamily)
MPAIRADILAEGDMHWIAAGGGILHAAPCCG